MFSVYMVIDIEQWNRISHSSKQLCVTTKEILACVMPLRGGVKQDCIKRTLEDHVDLDRLPVVCFDRTISSCLGDIVEYPGPVGAHETCRACLFPELQHMW